MKQNAEPYIETYSGEKFYFLNPTEDSIHIKDIAHALANKCRFAGHCSDFYSVAEHSYIVSILVEPHLALEGLLHDASEAYLEDIPRPIKPYFKEYKGFEDKIMGVISKKFGISFPESPEVKVADSVQLISEARHLMPSRGEVDYPQIPEGRIGKKPKCLPPFQAKKLFLGRFYELTNTGPIEASSIIARL